MIAKRYLRYAHLRACGRGRDRFKPRYRELKSRSRPGRTAYRLISAISSLKSILKNDYSARPRGSVGKKRQRDARHSVVHWQIICLRSSENHNQKWARYKMERCEPREESTQRVCACGIPSRCSRCGTRNANSGTPRRRQVPDQVIKIRVPTQYVTVRSG
jgi:hypothetical protein